MLDRARIGFKRDLDVACEIEPRGDAVEQARDFVRREQTRRAAAKKYTLQHAALREWQILIEISQQRIDVLALRQRARRVVRIEIAVRAFAHAPWDMDVKRKWRQ